MVCVALADKGKDGRTGRVKLGLALLGRLLRSFDEVGQGSRFRGGEELSTQTGAAGMGGARLSHQDLRIGETLGGGGGRDDSN